VNSAIYIKPGLFSTLSESKSDIVKTQRSLPSWDLPTDSILTKWDRLLPNLFPAESPVHNHGTDPNSFYFGIVGEQWHGYHLNLVEQYHFFEHL
jgi:hypothetical protein